MEFWAREEPGAVVALGTTNETPVKHLRGITACSSKKVSWSIAHLKCVYTNVRSMGNKEELEATVQLESDNLINISIFSI